MTNYKSYFEELVLKTPEAELGQMFGKSCGKLNKKAFVAFFQNEMVFKVGAKEVKLLKQKYQGAQNWDPSGKGRAMKDWIQVPSAYIEDWVDLNQKASEFISN